MSAAITAAVVIGGASYYAASESNKAADRRASAQNTNNMMAANRSRDLATKNNEARKAELLRRFNIKTDKIHDTNQEVNQALSVELTDFTMQLAAASGKLENALATKHLEGRLAERMKIAQSIQAEMKKDTLVQRAEATHRKIGDNLEMMRMDYESEQMNVGIDLSNSINAANNQEVRNWAYSTSSGSAGVISSTVGGVASGVSLGTSINSATGGSSSTATTTG